jgi:hypothetical protein
MLLESSSFSIRSPVVFGEDTVTTSNSIEYLDSRIPQISFSPYHDKYSRWVEAYLVPTVRNAKSRPSVIQAGDVTAVQFFVERLSFGGGKMFQEP